MHSQSYQVPFRITDINLAFQEAEGIMRLESNRIVFEYKIQDALGIIVKSVQNELHLSIDEIKNLEIRDWWVTLRLILTVKTIKSIQRLPNSHSCELQIKIPAKHRHQLQQFVEALRYTLTKHRLHESDE